MPVRECEASGCEREISGHKMCPPHRNRMKKYGDPLAGPPFRKTRGAPWPDCSVGECQGEGRFKGADEVRLCENHHRRWKLYGDPEGRPVERPPLSEAQLAALTAGRVAAWDRPKLSPAEVAQRLRVAQRNWRRANPEKVKAAKRAWASGRSVEVRREQQRSTIEGRQARKAALPQLSAEEMLFAAEYEVILRSDPCVYCGKLGGTVDHIVSVFDGGDDSVDNLAGSCRPCNSSKRNKSLLDFMLWRLKRTHEFKEVM